MVRQALAASAATLFLIAGSPGAHGVEQEELPFSDARTYLLVGGSNGIELFHQPATDSADNGVGFNLRFGKRVASHFAVESQFDRVSGYDSTASGANIWTIGTNVKAFLLTDRVQPYMLVGMGGIFATGKVLEMGKVVDVNGNGFMGRFGVGLDVYATERIGISLESAYVLPTSGASDFENITISWSLFYRFDNEDDE